MLGSLLAKYEASVFCFFFLLYIYIYETDQTLTIDYKPPSMSLSEQNITKHVLFQELRLNEAQIYEDIQIT